MYRLVALNLAWSGWYRLSESFHSPAFRGIAALSKSAQMSDKINAKEANHCYLLMRSLLPPSCAGTFYTSPRCRAKAEALGVQCRWVFQRKFGGWWPLRHTWKDINPRHPPARGRGEDGELGELSQESEHRQHFQPRKSWISILKLCRSQFNHTMPIRKLLLQWA